MGLLQENIENAAAPASTTVLLTNDLTIRVAEEAIEKKASVIVSYRMSFLSRCKRVRETWLISLVIQIPSSSVGSSQSRSSTRISASSSSSPSTTSPCVSLPVPPTLDTNLTGVQIAPTPPSTPPLAV